MNVKALVRSCSGIFGSHFLEGLLELGYNVIGIDASTDYHSKDG